MTAFRDTVMDALLALLQAQCGDTFLTYGRRFLTWEDVVQAVQTQGQNPLRQPALFLFDGVGLGGGMDRYEPRGRSTPGVITLTRTIVVYAQLPGGGTPGGADFTTPGGTVFYPLQESIQDALNADLEAATNTQTLGGLVSHCWLEGDALLMTGELDRAQGQGMLTMPVKIMLYPTSR